LFSVLFMKKLFAIIFSCFTIVLIIISVVTYKAAKDNPVQTTLVAIDTSSNSIIPNPLHKYILIKNWNANEPLPQGAKVLTTPNGGVCYLVPIFSSKVYAPTQNY
jgi:hypothetical protein